jgi:predicted nucleotidyltransferase
MAQEETTPLTARERCYNKNVAMIEINPAKNIRERFPTLAEIMGKKELISTFQQLSRAGQSVELLFHQLEKDLKYLARHLKVQTLSRVLRGQLRDKKESVSSVYEVCAAALLASVSEEIQLHVPTKRGKKCDFRVKIHGCEIYGEVKTRDDTLPFNIAPEKDDDGEDVCVATRATVDPHVADGNAGAGEEKPIPESTELRQRIVKALEQLPDEYPNLVVLGLIGDHDSPQKTQVELEAALFGDEFFRAHGALGIEKGRYPNGIFTDPIYGKQVTSIAWLCLKRSRGLSRRSGIFFNQNAQHRLPEEVRACLEHVFDREKSLRKELDRIVEKLKSDYQPEKIILFGSLAHGTVKEGSDIDLAIIKKTDKRPLDRSLEVARICQPSLAVNFVVYTPAEFRRRQQAGDFFVAEEILQKGHPLYER